MNCLVIGGGGFLGRFIVQQLIERGDSVRSFDLTPCPVPGIDSVIGDLRNPAQVAAAVAGMDTVFLCAAAVILAPGYHDLMEQVNVGGTQTVIAACAAAGVQKLVYTSSIDAIYDGTPLCDADETTPYPTRFLDHYSRTKAAAEKAIRAANGQANGRPGGLLTAAIRTGGIYGEHDRHRFPTLIKSARDGKLIRLGDGKARHTHVYGGNVAHLHLLVADQLAAGSPVAGSVYHAADFPTGSFFEFVQHFLGDLGIQVRERTIPYRVALLLAYLAELRYQLNKGREPLLTRYAVNATCRDFTLSAEKARRELGYQPRFSEDEARLRTVAWLRENYM